MGQGEQIGAQAVVKTYQLSNAFGRKALQEPAQGALVGESLQPEHLQKSAVVLQNVGLVDTSKPHDHGVQKRQDHLRGMIFRTPLRQSDVVLEPLPQPQFVAKTLDEPHPTEVSKMAFLEGKTDFAGTFWHHAQSTLLGAFVRQSYPQPYALALPSGKPLLAIPNVTENSVTTCHLSPAAGCPWPSLAVFFFSGAAYSLTHQLQKGHLAVP